MYCLSQVLIATWACRVSEGGKSKVGKVRIADIDVHCSEGPLCSLSFESERYGPHAYHGDDIAS